MKKLSKDEVLHVADLAKLSVTEEEINIYSAQLTAILTEINKITDVDIEPNEPILIAPTSNKNVFRKDEEEIMLEKKDIFKNVNKKSGDYVVVPKVIHD